MPESIRLIIDRLTFWPVSVGQEKSSDGGPAQYQASGRGSPVLGGPACRGDPAVGGRLDPWCAFARGLLRPQPVFQPVQFFAAPRSNGRPRGTGAAAGGDR